MYKTRVLFGEPPESRALFAMAPFHWPVRTGVMKHMTDNHHQSLRYLEDFPGQTSDTSILQAVTTMLGQCP